MIVVAIDIGGTFTDLIGFDAEQNRFIEAKSLTTPSQLTRGIIDCIRKSGLDAGAIDELIHGSTIAINTLIERKGARTGLIVTRGTRDVYIIGRGNRPEAYNLLFHKHRPLVERHLIREAQERLLASGDVHEKLQAASIEDACEKLKAAGVEAVAVSFLHSYANPEHERQAGAIVRAALPDTYVSLSHEILREYREYERTSTTVVNAYIGPKVGGYVKSLHHDLGAVGFRGDLAIMRSNGGVMTPEVATDRPVAMMESGPVGGIIASARVGQALGYQLEEIYHLPPETIARAGEGDEAAMRACDEERFRQGKRTAAEQRPSMGQDMQKGRRTEIEFLNGLVVREGEKVGVTCRANAVLTDIVRRVERGEFKADPRHITELRLN